MLFQAHRGVSTEYPENTMPAFRAAQEQGYQYIELDPEFTVDNHCVVFHDRTVNRTCRTADGQLIAEQTNIWDMTLEEILALDAGLYKGEEFRGTKVPLLKEALEFAAQAGLHVKIDNKFQRFTPEQKQILFDIAEQSGADFAFTCTKPEIIDLVAERFPNHRIHYDGAVDEATLLEVKAHLKNNPLTVWLPIASQLTSWVKVPLATESLCAMVKEHAQLGLWILETQEELETAAALGADVIETTGAVKP